MGQRVNVRERTGDDDSQQTAQHMVCSLGKNDALMLLYTLITSQERRLQGPRRAAWPPQRAERDNRWRPQCSSRLSVIRQVDHNTLTPGWAYRARWGAP